VAIIGCKHARNLSERFTILTITRSTTATTTFMLQQIMSHITTKKIKPMVLLHKDILSDLLPVEKTNPQWHNKACMQQNGLTIHFVKGIVVIIVKGTIVISYSRVLGASCTIYCPLGLRHPVHSLIFLIYCNTFHPINMVVTCSGKLRTPAIK